MGIQINVTWTLLEFDQALNDDQSEELSAKLDIQTEAVFPFHITSLTANVLHCVILHGRCWQTKVR